MNKRRGFTLIEMLIAIAITASIGVVAYRALDGALLAKEKVTQVTERLDEVDRVWQYVSNDLVFATPRTWVNAYGDNRSAMVGVFGDRLSQSDVVVADESSYLLQFIRHNRDNILDRPRSDLFMVGYRLTEDEGGETKTLWRDSWTPIDGSDEPKMQKRRLLKGIVNMSFRYLPASAKGVEKSNSSWITGWPGSEGATASLPAAIEVTVDIEGLGEVVRLFALTAPAASTT